MQNFKSEKLIACPRKSGSGRMRLARGTMLSALGASGLAAAAVLTAVVPVRAESDFYAGKTLRIIVGSSAGGGYDTYARTIAPFLGEHIPGKPSVLVQNMPGGGGMTSVLYLDASAPKDGTAITLFNAGVITDVASNPAKARVDLTKLAWIGSATRSFRACYFWAASGIKTWDDLVRPKGATLGATGVKSGSYNDAQLLKNLFGRNVRAIAGYPGRTEVHLAIERGEVDGECGTPEAIPTNWIKDKKINWIVRLAKAVTPDIPNDVPWIGKFVKSQDDLKVLQLLTAANELGRPVVASEHVPAERLQILRAAFDATMADPKYRAAAVKRKLSVSPVTGKEAQETIVQIMTATDKVRARARAIIK